MSRGVRVRVWGDLALFSRPEMKVERRRGEYWRQSTGIPG